ncbi:MAG: ribonuclease D [Ponticaulis sp.]|nr:ribonuclease D [Ponticaulis sp.]|tara:strand:+ start:29977 stop:31173 length:1197 start_codon:yes stop_codon:yes gene_type:complete
MSDKEITVITDQNALNAFCEQLKTSRVVFVDTEFHRESTYWPTLCLIQAAGDDVEGIIDPMVEGIDLSPFLDIMSDPDIGKVFHAARQDMEIFARLIGTPPAPIFDTQIAAMALGLGDSISYDNLISQLTGKQVDKSSQFTDWTRRPLSQKQLHYALGDVTHLRAAYAKMAETLDEKERWSWIEEDHLALSAPELYLARPENAWKRMKLRRHRKDYLAVLKSVAVWREALAQELNRPRSRVLKDDAVQEIADQRPRDANGLDRLRSLPKGFGKSRHGSGLLEAINNALDDPDAYAPDVEKPKHRGPTPAGAADLLRVLLKQICDDENVTPRLIANSADLERIASGDGDSTAVMSGWRYDLFGKHAENLLHGKLAVTFNNGQIEMFNTEGLPHIEPRNS